MILPNMHSTASVGTALGATGGAGWVVPRDDTSFRYSGIERSKSSTSVSTTQDEIGFLDESWGPGKPVTEWTTEDHQRWQTDWAAQKGQGDINLHSEEHLTSIDRGTAMIRRLFRRAAMALEEGTLPVGSTPGESYRVVVTAGNGILADDPLVRDDGYDGR